MEKTKKKVWIDTDPAFEEIHGDCDDGYCIISLFHSKCIEVIGMSACFGNADIEITYSKLVYLKSHFPLLFCFLILKIISTHQRLFTKEQERL